MPKKEQNNQKEPKIDPYKTKSGSSVVKATTLKYPYWPAEPLKKPIFTSITP
jgi:hypothetical protein